MCVCSISGGAKPQVSASLGQHSPPTIRIKSAPRILRIIPQTRVTSLVMRRNSNDVYGICNPDVAPTIYALSWECTRVHGVY